MYLSNTFHSRARHRLLCKDKDKFIDISPITNKVNMTIILYPYMKSLL